MQITLWYFLKNSVTKMLLYFTFLVKKCLLDLRIS